MASVDVELDLGPILVLKDEGIIDREAALEEIGVFLTSEAQAAFRSQGWRGGTAWPPRMVPNIAGILKDLQTSANLKRRRLQARPALVDTGGLRGSFDFLVDAEEGSVQVGTNHPAAASMHFGIASTIPGAGRGSSARDPVRKNLFMLLQRNPRFREQLGVLFGIDELTIKPRARLLVEYPDVIAQEVGEIIQSHRRFPEKGPEA